MSEESRRRTVQTIASFRPAFRAVTAALTDLDLIFVEEAFERLLLDYDRVFSQMGTPACCASRLLALLTHAVWRRTGEIMKANAEFATLAGVPIHQLREGKVAIYELMTEGGVACDDIAELHRLCWRLLGSLRTNMLGSDQESRSLDRHARLAVAVSHSTMCLLLHHSP